MTPSIQNGVKIANAIIEPDASLFVKPAFLDFIALILGEPGGLDLQGNYCGSCSLERVQSGVIA